MKKYDKCDSWWYIEGRKTPICGSTRATADFLHLLLEANGGSFKKALEQINYDEEARQVCRKMIDEGCD